MKTMQSNSAPDHLQTDEKLFDLGFIEKICRGNLQVRDKMLRTFIATIPAAVDELKEAQTKADFGVLKDTAHRIKPVLRFYALVTVENDVIEIESLAQRNTGLTEIEQKISKLDAVVKTVVHHLQTDYLTA